MADHLAAMERVRDLLDRLERTRARLEEVEGEQAVDVLRELSELARDVQGEIEKTRRAGVSSERGGAAPAAGETGGGVPAAAAPVPGDASA